MLGITHCTIGTGAGLALALATHQPPLQAGALALLGGLGGLLPDVDSPHALIHRLAIVTRLVALFVKHRGITHSLLALALVGALALRFPPWGLALALGYSSHLIADAVTIEGIPLLYPWGRMFHLLPPHTRLKTGGLVESFIRVGTVLGVVWGVGVLVGIYPDKVLGELLYIFVK